LRGQVAVKIPTTFEIEMGIEELFIYCLYNIDDIDWIKIAHGDAIRQELRSEMYKLEITKENIADKIVLL
jgi:hypothetical protein